MFNCLTPLWELRELANTLKFVFPGLKPGDRAHRAQKRLSD